jgi:signal transduction histidine kinase
LNNAADAITERIEKIPAETGDYKGQIGLTARWDEENDAVIIQISDNGIGMTEQVSAKVFSLHFSTKKGGHGLGLHNCKKIAEQHGGTLTHTSEYGRGTTFTLNLPRHKVSPDGNET